MIRSFISDVTQKQIRACTHSNNVSPSSSASEKQIVLGSMFYWNFFASFEVIEYFCKFSDNIYELSSITISNMALICHYV